MPWPSTGNNRADMAAGIKTELAKTGWQVYDHPADVVKLPCWVVDIGSPWIEKDTLGGYVTQAYEVSAVVARSNPRTAYTVLEGAVYDLWLALLPGPSSWQVDSSGEPEQISYNDLEALRVTTSVMRRLT